MRKIVSLFVLVLALASCGKDVEFNSPAFQATKNGAFWKANDMQAFADAGGLTITAAVGTDVVILHTSAATPGTYTLGTGLINTATYQSVDGEGALYATGSGVGSGEIIISPGQTEGTITGKFEFIAEDEEGNEVNFTNGNFYKVPR